MSVPPIPTVIRQLNADWAALLGTTTFITHRDRWVHNFPAALAHASQGPLYRCHSQVDAATWSASNDQELFALLTEFRRGDALAGRAALQIMSPCIVFLTRGVAHRFPSVEDAASATCAAIWQALCLVPLSPDSTHLAGAVKMRALNSLAGRAAAWRKQRLIEIPFPAGDDSFALEDAHSLLGRPAFGGPPGAAGAASSQSTELDAQEIIAQLLAWGLDAAVLNAQEAALLARCYLRTDGRNAKSLREISVDLDISHCALRARVSRLTRRLAAAVHDPHRVGSEDMLELAR